MIDAERLYFPTLNTFTTYLPLCIHLDIICFVSELAGGELRDNSICLDWHQSDRVSICLMNEPSSYLVIDFHVCSHSVVSMFHVRVRINM